MSGIYMLTVITKRSIGGKIQKLFEKSKLPEIIKIMAKGTTSCEMLDCFGMEVTEKTVFISVVTEESWKTIKQGLEKSIWIDIPGTGIAFLSPLSSIGGGRAFRFLTDGQIFERNEESIMKNTKYELIVAIANHGTGEIVMNAARAQGAAGGTVIHAKGTGKEKAEKFLGISIADEKDMIFIVAKTEDKNRIMKSIMRKAGIESQAKAVVFSVPVTDTAGLRLEEIQ